MKKSVAIISHATFWLVYYSFSFIPLRFYFGVDEMQLIYQFNQFFIPLCFYLGYFGLLRNKKNKNYFFYSIFYLMIIYFTLFFIFKKTFVLGTNSLFIFLVWETLIFIFFIVLGFLFRFFIDWFKKKNTIHLLEKTNMESQLAILKMQINPHFLYNTLHNIDTLIYDDQEKASKSIVKLSDIMRYMLNDAKYEFVELEKEINHLEDYISLEKLRLKNDKFLNFSVLGDIKGVKIAPMILIPFVENAFKHSVDSDIENGIIINLKFENDRIEFVCENKFDLSDTDKDKGHGIGLETVKKRLELIYSNHHKLEINVNESIFKVNLEIKINEN